MTLGFAQTNYKANEKTGSNTPEGLKVPINQALWVKHYQTAHST
jgi:hypothetical protein